MTVLAEAQAAGAYLDKMDSEIAAMRAESGNPAGQQTGANHGQEAQGHKEVLIEAAE